MLIMKPRTWVPRAWVGLLLVPIAPGVFPAPSLPAQEPAPDDIAVAAVAIITARDSLEHNTVGLAEGAARLQSGKLGPRPWAPEWAAGPHPAALLEALEDLLELEASERSEVLRCPDGPGSCDLHGATVLIAWSEPRIDGGQARIAVEITYRSEVGSRPVLVNGWEMLLERGAEGWGFVRFETGWVS
jgi:hypothetical protein